MLGILGVDIFTDLIDKIIGWNVHFEGVVMNDTTKVLLVRKHFRMSQIGRKQYTFAQILSILQTNPSDQAIHTIFSMIMQPIEFFYCAFFIYYYVGCSVFAGVILWLIRMGINKYFEERKVDIQNKMREYEEEVTQKTTEAFMNIKLLKLYGWEEKFSERIKKDFSD